MSENPETFVGIDISKDTLDIGFQPSEQTVRLPHDERGITEATKRLARINALVLADFARAIRPEVRPLKDALPRELGDLITRRRQLVDMRVQEALRLGHASEVQEKSLKRHITWLDKRIEDIETDMRKRLRESPVWRTKDDLLPGIPGVGETTTATLLAKLPDGAPWTAKASPHSPVSPPSPTTAADNGAGGSSGADVLRSALFCTCRPSRPCGAIPSSAPSPNA